MAGDENFSPLLDSEIRVAFEKAKNASNTQCDYLICYVRREIGVQESTQAGRAVEDFMVASRATLVEDLVELYGNREGIRIRDVYPLWLDYDQASRVAFGGVLLLPRTVYFAAMEQLKLRI